jgi:hypothetical protein
MRMRMVFRRAMQQDIHLGADMNMAQLQRSSQSKHHGNVLPWGSLFADDFDFGGWTGRNAAGQGRIGVDVEFEKVEKGIVDHGDCAVDFAFFSVVEFKGTTGFVACWEGFPFDFVFFVFDMFASFSANH